MHFYLVLIIICIVCFNIVIKRYFLSPLSAYPGPFLASVTRLWYTYIHWQGKQHEVLPRLHKKYGDIVRVAPNEVHLCTSEALRAVYGPGSPCVKSDWFRVFQGQRQFDLVSERNRQKHAEERRLVSQIYSGTNIRYLEPYIDITLSQLLKRFDEKLNRPFDISDWIQYWSFDTIGMLTFSQPFGFLSAGSDWNSALHQIRSAGDSAAWVGQNPWFYLLCERLLFPLLWGYNPFALANRNGVIREFATTQSQLRQKRAAASSSSQQKKQQQQDIMSSLLTVHEQNPQSFPSSAVNSMVATNIFGGAETTTSSTRAVLYYVLRNPHVAHKLQKETDIICVAHAWPPGQPVSLNLAEKMPYLHAVVYEAMRLFPANGLPLARVTPPEGLYVNDRYFPPNVQITVYSWSLHRSEKVFGGDAGEFRPERWLDDDEEGDSDDEGGGDDGDKGEGGGEENCAKDDEQERKEREANDSGSGDGGKDDDDRDGNKYTSKSHDEPKSKSNPNPTPTPKSKSKARITHLHRNFFSFGMGARICLGRHLAWMEILKVVSTLFWCFDIELEDREKEWIVEGGFIKGQRGIDVILTRRNELEKMKS